MSGYTETVQPCSVRRNTVHLLHGCPAMGHPFLDSKTLLGSAGRYVVKNYTPSRKQKGTVTEVPAYGSGERMGGKNLHRKKSLPETDGEKRGAPL